MAVSGSTDFTLTTNTIITEALEHIGGVEMGQTVSGEKYSSALRTLNIMLKAWQAEGTSLRTVDWETQILTASGTVLGTDGSDYECIRNHTSSSDDTPITGNNYSSFWYKLSTTAASAWVTATAYTSIANFTLGTDTLGIERMFIRDSERDYPVTSMTREEYARVSSKSPEDQGRPTRFFFDFQETPIIYLHPYPDDSTDVLNIYRERLYYDFDATTDNPDVHVKYYEAMVYGLAHRLATKYGRPNDTISNLFTMAEVSKGRAFRDDSERGPMQVGIYRGRS